MNKSDKNDYMEITSDLMIKNGITILEFTVFGINKLTKDLNLSKEVCDYLTDNLCRELKDQLK